MDYLKFVEDQRNKNYNWFEKVLMASKRAKDLYDKQSPEESKRAVVGHKPTYQAILEINEGKTHLRYRSPEEMYASGPTDAENDYYVDEVIPME